MPFLTGISLMGSGFFVLLSCLVIMLARTQPPSEFIPNLGRCEERICYLGIVPGEVDWDTGQQILLNIPGLVVDPRTDWYRNLPGFSGSMRIIYAGYDTQDVVLWEVDLMPDDASVKVGSAFIQWGRPCAAHPTGDDDLTLLYPGMTLLADTHKSRGKLLLTPTTPLIQINLFSQLQSCQGIDGDLTLYDWDWHGFGQYSPS